MVLNGAILRLHRLGSEAEDFCRAVEFVGQIGNIGRDHWRAGDGSRFVFARGVDVMRAIGERCGGAGLGAGVPRGCAGACAEQAYAEDGGVLKEFSAGVGVHFFLAMLLIVRIETRNG